jgi:molybdenum cofactor cytidylyltransferase
MGTPKVLLPLQGSPLIAHVITAWQAAGLAPLVVVRPTDQKLIEVCRAYGAEVLIPAAPPAEMKHSVQLALADLEQRYRPPADFAWLLAPADMPKLSPAIVRRLLAQHGLNWAHSSSPPILVPISAGRRGHPVLFPWRMASQVFTLGPEDGVKALLSWNQVREIPCDDLLEQNEAAFADVDTPADYERLRTVRSNLLPRPGTPGRGPG